VNVESLIPSAEVQTELRGKSRQSTKRRTTDGSLPPCVKIGNMLRFQKFDVDA